MGHCFAKKIATESYRLLVEVYGDDALAKTQCFVWFERFKSGDIKDKECPRQPKKFEDEELETLLDEDSCQTQDELGKSLGVTQQAISKRLKATRYIQKQGKLVPYELKP